MALSHVCVNVYHIFFNTLCTFFYKNVTKNWATQLIPIKADHKNEAYLVQVCQQYSIQLSYSLTYPLHSCRLQCTKTLHDNEVHTERKS